MNNLEIPSSLTGRLYTYILNPRSAVACFNLAYEYEQLTHVSSAITFYIKALEYSTDSNLKYEIQIRIGLIFLNISKRDSLAKGVFYRAIALLPHRTEAYYFLCKVYEKAQFWSECYLMSSTGYEVSEPGKFITEIERCNKQGLLFYKGLSAWWIDKSSESLHIMRQIAYSSNDTYLKEVAKNNVKVLEDKLSIPSNLHFTYYHRHNLKVKFPNLDTIENNYSETLQDIFVLMCTQGKKGGRFLEIGCGRPQYRNNTYLLESKFAWSGTSIDNNSEFLEEWKDVRKTVPILEDARVINWTSTLKYSHYDYLQIDCEPGLVSLQILQSLPLHDVMFSVITFEHDYYVDLDPNVRDLSREYLESFGYRLLIGNVSSDNYRPYEDWWVHPKYISQSVIDKLQRPLQDVNRVVDCIFMT